MDTGKAQLWAEFLRRFAPRIRVFVRKKPSDVQRKSAPTPDRGGERLGSKYPAPLGGE